ncbi:hypothetical protein [Streptomyces olivoreticuli]|uniref:hypothetical protein n=1 Tax=Streptomyces olivoreticuli TaxID=68246 RepID=UPI0013C2F48B|nr:hypothetical protein [Streptomyces olivoreticuli]
MPVAPRDEFDMYAIHLDLGSWSYALDDVGLVYGPGWFPFHRHIERVEPNPSAPLLPRSVPTGKTAPTPVRISPDVEHRAWRNEYVVLQPVDHRVQAHMRLYAGGRGAGARIRRVAVEVDLRNLNVAVPAQCPAPLRHQAAVKGRRVLDLLMSARIERRLGLSAPTGVLAPGLHEPDNAEDGSAESDSAR